MIDGFVSWKPCGELTERAGTTGRSFVTAKARTVANDGEMLFVNVIAFPAEVKAAPLALDDGDSVALASTFTPKVWIDRSSEAKPALDLVAHSVLTAYQVKRKRVAVQSARSGDVHGNARATTSCVSRATAFYDRDFADKLDELQV